MNWISVDELPLMTPAENGSPFIVSTDLLLWSPGRTTKTGFCRQYSGETAEFLSTPQYDIERPTHWSLITPPSDGVDNWVRCPACGSARVEFQSNEEATDGIELWFVCRDCGNDGRGVDGPVNHCDKHAETQLDCPECVATLPELTDKQVAAMNIEAVLAEACQEIVIMRDLMIGRGSYSRMESEAIEKCAAALELWKAHVALRRKAGE